MQLCCVNFMFAKNTLILFHHLQTTTMISLLIKNFLRTRSLMLALLLIFVVGLVSLHVGKRFIDQQAEIIEMNADKQEESIERYVKYNADDIGLLLYYLKFGLANETPNLTGLSIGHRDIHPTIQNAKILNLEGQKYASRYANPMYQLLGKMDFGFVLVYFFPLIIIALCYNLLSEEKEGNTWGLMLIQSQNPLKIIRQKLLIRLVSVLSVLIILLIIGKIYLAIPADAAFFAFVLTAVLYVCFWFALAWLVISFDRSSTQNAQVLLLAWVVLTFVVPTAINALSVNLYPVPEAYETMLQSRDGYHNKWDEPKAPTIEKFQEKYPQFSKYEHPEGKNFSWFWYYAMQHTGDEEAATAAKAIKERLALRDQFSRTLGYVFPSLHTQFTLNALCKSDMTNYLNFIQQLETNHEEKRLYFYPKIFDNKPVSGENWKDFSQDYSEDARGVNWLGALLPLLVVSLLLVFWLSLIHI